MPSLRLVVVTASRAVGAAVEASLPAHVVEPKRSLPEALDALMVWWPDATPEETSRLVRAAREAEVPLVALCRAEPDEQARALDAGADAACTLPLHPALLRAQVAAYHRIRRAEALVPSALPATPLLEEGALRMDRRARTLTVRSMPVSLTLKEFDLLAFLLGHAGTCCTRDVLLEHVWGLDFNPGTNSLDVFIYLLRRKLREAGIVDAIQTVRGAGYRLDPDALS